MAYKIKFNNSITINRNTNCVSFDQLKDVRAQCGFVQAVTQCCPGKQITPQSVQLHAQVLSSAMQSFQFTPGMNQNRSHLSKILSCLCLWVRKCTPSTHNNSKRTHKLTAFWGGRIENSIWRFPIASSFVCFRWTGLPNIRMLFFCLSYLQTVCVCVCVVAVSNSIRKLLVGCFLFVWLLV